jgi:arylsulfatase A-like enzyme
MKKRNLPETNSATMQNNGSRKTNSIMDLSRRDFLGRSALIAAGAGAASLLGSTSAFSAIADQPERGNAHQTSPGRNLNILFILTDQERYFRQGELPDGYRLPGHEKLAARGTVFENHRINSCVCTPSRSVVYTGRHIQDTKMFDNTNFPWINSLSTDLPTLGHMMHDAGYYPAYKGKWHLTKEFEMVNELGSPTKIFTKEMKAYGFSDYFGIGDIIGHDRGGYLHDGIISAMSVNWLRGRGKELAAEGKPWFLAVNMVNPHDIMFLNTDRPGQPVQAGKILGHIRPEPEDPLYQKQWQFELPQTYTQALDAPGRPAAHKDYMRSHDGLVGNISNEDWRWKKRHNYYLNCLRDVDRNISALLDELDNLGFASNTIIVLTADHGDLDGAHRLHAKGATSYREQNNVPLIVVHPAYHGGKRCKAVTSHLDLAPTLIGLTGANAEKKAAITKACQVRIFRRCLARQTRKATTQFGTACSSARTCLHIWMGISWRR